MTPEQTLKVWVLARKKGYTTQSAIYRRRLIDIRGYGQGNIMHGETRVESVPIPFVMC